MKPRILRFKDVVDWSNCIYVGRPSIYGNPYSHKENTLAKFRVSSSAEAVDNYKIWVMSQPELLSKIKNELTGKDLVCWCEVGAPCHARVIYEIANGCYPEEEDSLNQPSLFN